MPNITIPVSKVEAIRVTGRGRNQQVVQRRKLSDMSDAELKATYAGNCTPDLRYAISLELQNRKLRSTVNAALADQELREEVIEALMKEGKSERIARNLVLTEDQLVAEGRRLNII